MNAPVWKCRGMFNESIFVKNHETRLTWFSQIWIDLREISVGEGALKHSLKICPINGGFLTQGPIQKIFSERGKNNGWVRTVLQGSGDGSPPEADEVLK